MGNAVAAVVELLTGVAAGRVFGARLPAGQTTHMPRMCVIVRAAGSSGVLGGGYLPVVDDRIDLRCYGATPWEASQLAGQVSMLLHQVRDTTTGHGRVLWARRSAAPMDVTETDTTWPLTLTSWQVMGTWLDT